MHHVTESMFIISSYKTGLPYKDICSLLYSYETCNKIFTNKNDKIFLQCCETLHHGRVKSARVNLGCLRDLGY